MYMQYIQDIVLSFAPSAAAVWHCDRVRITCERNSVRHICIDLQIKCSGIYSNSTAIMIQAIIGIRVALHNAHAC